MYKGLLFIGKSLFQFRYILTLSDHITMRLFVHKGSKLYRSEIASRSLL